jgi:hypothetical protein
MAKDDDKDIHLKVVVNGKAVALKAAPIALLGSLIPEALDKAKVADKSDLDRWVFTNEAGTQLDKSQTVGSFGFAHNQEVSLNLSAGVVG